VFFKVVKSKIKFMQMIGRGTRLSKDIFGTGKDKEFFYIFDWCRNFEYFDKNPDGQKAKVVPSLTEKIFALRAKIAFHLQHQKHQEDAYSKGLHDEIKALLRAQVGVLSDSHISVREKWETVSRFKDAYAWVYLSEVDVNTLSTEIAPLLPRNTLDENAKKFDLLVMLIELSLLDGETNSTKAVNSVHTIAEKLQEKATLPQVQAKMPTIKEVLSDVAWQNVSLAWLEKVRNDLRDLLKFLTGQDDRWFMVDIEDEITDEGKIEGITPRMSYKQSVLNFLSNNRNLPVLKKIENMEQLTDADFSELERILWNELGTKDDYDRYTIGMTCGSNVAVFIRSIVGVDRKNAVRRFSDFISGQELNAEQEDFLTTIIAYVCENGDITKETVVNEPPFDERLNVFLPHMSSLVKYIETIHEVVTPQTA
jgi:type I restriction enzyme R subunit